MVIFFHNLSFSSTADSPIFPNHYQAAAVPDEINHMKWFHICFSTWIRGVIASSDLNKSFSWHSLQNIIKSRLSEQRETGHRICLTEAHINDWRKCQTSNIYNVQFLLGERKEFSYVSRIYLSVSCKVVLIVPPRFHLSALDLNLKSEEKCIHV